MDRSARNRRLPQFWQTVTAKVSRSAFHQLAWRQSISQSVPFPAIAACFGALALGASILLVLFGKGFARSSDCRRIIAARNDGPIDGHRFAEAVQDLIHEAALIKFGEACTWIAQQSKGQKWSKPAFHRLAQGV